MNGRHILIYKEYPRAGGSQMHHQDSPQIRREEWVPISAIRARTDGDFTYLRNDSPADKFAGEKDSLAISFGAQETRTTSYDLQVWCRYQ